MEKLGSDNDDSGNSDKWNEAAAIRLMLAELQKGTIWLGGVSEKTKVEHYALFQPLVECILTAVTTETNIEKSCGFLFGVQLLKHGIKLAGFGGAISVRKRETLLKTCERELHEEGALRLHSSVLEHADIKYFTQQRDAMKPQATHDSVAKTHTWYHRVVMLPSSTTVARFDEMQLQGSSDDSKFLEFGTCACCDQP